MTRIPAINDGSEDAATAGSTREPGREDAREASASSQDLLRALTDNSASLIYALDAAGRFLLNNPRLESVFGVPRETLIGRTREANLPPSHDDVPEGFAGPQISPTVHSCV